MKNEYYICVMDFETGGINPKKCAAIQIAAAMIDPRRLEWVPKATFNSMMRPSSEEFDTIEDDALKVNKKTREQILAAPPQAVVWPQFTSFVQKYKVKGRMPIFAGKNIVGFDLVIAERLCKKYGPWDKKRDEQGLWNPKNRLDLEDILWTWFENSDELADYKMDTVRPYFGISNEGSHSAEVDVKHTGDILLKFLRLHRNLANKVTFKNSFAV